MVSGEDVPTLTTQRLHLRPWSFPRDLDFAFAIYGDPAVMRYIRAAALTANEAMNWLTAWQMEAQLGVPQGGVWAVLVSDTHGSYPDLAHSTLNPAVIEDSLPAAMPSPGASSPNTDVVLDTLPAAPMSFPMPLAASANNPLVANYWATSGSSSSQSDLTPFVPDTATPCLDRHLVGTVLLLPLTTTQPVTPDTPWEIGWHLRRCAWGQGYATEAARAVLEYAFQVLALPAVMALVKPDNLRSHRVAEKLGMQFCEITTQYYGMRLAQYLITPAQLPAESANPAQASNPAEATNPVEATNPDQVRSPSQTQSPDLPCE